MGVAKHYKNKVCAVCGITFSPSSPTSLYCSKICRGVVKNKRGRQNRLDNPEKVRKYHREYQRVYRQKPIVKAKLHEYTLIYYKNNREKIREKARKNWPRECAYHQQWRDNNRDKWNGYNHIRRARTMGGGGKYTQEELNSLFEQQEGCCYLCGKLLFAKFDDQVSVEHKLPVSRGGSNYISNIGLAHLSCNKRKSTKTPEEFMVLLR